MIWNTCLRFQMTSIPDDLEYLYVVGSGSHVQYCHARQLK